MKQISIEDTHDGDTVARNLTNDAGTVILSKGTRLSASMISRLKKMNIKQISVTDDDADAWNEEHARQLALLEKRFAGCEDNPYLSELKRIVADHLQTQ